MGEARMNRRKIASLVLAVGLIASLVAALAGTAAGQTAQGQLTAVNGASADAVDVAADSTSLASGLDFASAGQGVIVDAGTSYTVAFTDGSVGTVAVDASTAFNVVSGYGDNGETAKGYPIEVAEIPDGKAVANVWNATTETVLVRVNGSDPFEILAGEGNPWQTIDPGDFTVQVGDVTRTYSAQADNYVDAFVVNDGSATDVAFAVVPSMTALIEALGGSTPPPPEDPTVPDVAGQSAVDATATLVEAGFDVAERAEPSDDVAEGVAIGTEPAAGTQVPAGSTVTLLVSTGPSTVEVPDVAGQPLDDAVAELEELGFTTSIEEQVSDEVEEGLVISTNPLAGTQVAPGTQVVVVVSTGPEDVVVPDFVGMTVEEANEAAEIAGLEPVFVEDPDDPDPDGFVVEQDPVAGEVVPAGSEVTLQLSPATQDPWTSIKVEAGGLLKAAGLNFLPESVSEAVVIDSTVSGSAVVDDDGFWLITMSMAPLDPTIAYEMVVTGTAEDGSDYEQTFKVPAVGETGEGPVEDEGIPTWVWFVAGGILIAAIILGVVLVTNSSADGAAAAAGTEGAAGAEGAEGAAGEASGDVDPS
jgi:beta-lactam-binding protein with PASTA domain